MDETGQKSAAQSVELLKAEQWNLCASVARKQRPIREMQAEATTFGRFAVLKRSESEQNSGR